MHAREVSIEPANSIFGKIGQIASEEVILHLISMMTRVLKIDQPLAKL